MDGPTAKQGLLLDIDKIIYWRHGILEVDPQKEDNSRALKQLLAIREDVCAMKESDREFHRLATLINSARLNGASDRTEHAQIEYLQTYGTVMELASDPYSFIQDLILELGSVAQWSQIVDEAPERRSDAASRDSLSMKP